ncbi:hypothetical protein L3D22_10065 [Lysobacter soli]|uniref:hypothetical protein n=1 Tax=Lysobacter soli TaxID=453783 RepID=UPI00209F620C|nr:hypothetical protein [Lysobacter soli]UTA52741.1 hypothetical protein L3D22_10065 [Lysobacter soli]
MALFLWFASQWWEKAFATVTSTEVSPGGCYRLVEYKPFWLIPESFHPKRSPEQKWNPFKDWYGPWMPNKMPGFYRLYDNRTGEKLGETAVYNLTWLETGDIHWPDAELDWMSAGYLTLAEHLPPCSDGHR